MSYSDLTKGRVSLPHQAYLITTVCYQRTPVFLDMVYARLVINQMMQLQNNGYVQSLAFVLMPDHLHWLFYLKNNELSQVIRWLKGRTSREINALNNSVMSVWQRGFHDHAIRHEDDIKLTARYIIANPIRAGIVGNVAEYPHWDAMWLDRTLDA